eukprot:COSAG02_NODE_46852_length_345_cov_1.256098_1_plen_53_part_01
MPMTPAAAMGLVDANLGTGEVGAVRSVFPSSLWGCLDGNLTPVLNIYSSAPKV